MFSEHINAVPASFLGFDNNVNSSRDLLSSVQPTRHSVNQSINQSIKLKAHLSIAMSLWIRYAGV